MKFANKEEAIRAAQAAQQRKWRRENPEKNRELQRQYWLRKAAKLEESGEYVGETEEEAIRAAQAAQARKWRRENPEKNRELQRQYWLRKAEKLEESGEFDEE